MTSSTIVPAASGETIDTSPSVFEIQFEFDFKASIGDDGSTIVLNEASGTIDDMGAIVPCSTERVVLPQGSVTMIDVAYTFSDGESLGMVDPPRAMSESPISGPVEISEAPMIDRPMLSYGDVQRSRGVNLIDLTISPFTVGGPADGLVFHRSIDVTIEVSVNDDASFVDPDMDMIGDVVNPGMIGTYVATELPTDDMYDLLILTNNEMRAEFQRLADHREARGVECKIICVDDFLTEGTTSTNDDQDRIRNCIDVEYSFYGISYVLLGGDEEVIPHRSLYGSVNGGGTTDDDLAGDIYYAGLDGEWDDDRDNIYGEVGEEDLYTEVYLGRVPVSTSGGAGCFVDKVIAYETNPFPNDHALFIGQQLDDGPTWGGNSKDTMSVPAGVGVTKLYERDGTFSYPAMIDEINEGVGIINNAGHGNPDYMAEISADDIDDMDNSDYFIWFSHGCYCGSFDNRWPSGYHGSDCIGERLVYDEDAAVAFIGNSRYGWYLSETTDGACDRFDRAFFDQLCDGNLVIGKTLQRAKESLSGYCTGYGAMRWVYFDMNLLGDPCMTIRMTEPEGIEVTSPSSDDALIGGSSNEITWTDTTGYVESVSIYISDAIGNTYTVVEGVDDTGSRSIDVSDELIGHSVKVVVVDSEDPSVGGASPYVKVDIQPDEYEDDDTMAQSHAFEFGEWHTRNLGIDDDDWFHFTVDAYDSVMLNGTSSPDDDILFEIIPDGGGDPIETHREGQGDGWDTFYATNLQAGTYHVHTHCRDPGDVVSSYSMKVDRMRILIIHGEGDLAEQASARGWGGTGTSSDPIVISDLSLDAGDLHTGAIITDVGSSVVLRDVDVQSDMYGIAMTNVTDITIDACSIEDAHMGIYIPSEESGSITIRDTIIKHHFVGIYIHSIGYLEVSGCEIESRGADGGFAIGAHMYGAEHSLFMGNSFINCTIVPSIDGDSYQDNLDGMTITDDNTVDGAPIVFLKDRSDVEVTGDIGALIAYRSSGITIEAPSSIGTIFPVQMTLCEDVDIVSMECDDGIGCAYLVDCADIEVSACTFDGRSAPIIAVGVNDSSFNFNRFIGENENHTGEYAISIEGSRNELSRNEFIDCENCVFLGMDSSDNVVTRNNFLGTTINVDLGTGNSWSSDDEGNHWSVWTTPDDDGDGIVDDPYVVFSDGVVVRDAFPLVDAFDVSLLSIDPVDELIADSTVTISWRSNGPSFSSYEVRVDDANWTSVQGTLWTTPDLVDGEHTFEVRPVGQMTFESVTIVIDTTSPTIELSGPTGLINDPDPTFSWTVTDVGGLQWVRYQVDGGEWVNDALRVVTFHSMVDGHHTLSVSAMDLAGNLEVSSTTFDLDSTPPTVTGHTPIGDMEDFMGSGTVVFNEMMDERTLSLRLNDQPVQYMMTVLDGVTTLTFEYDVDVGSDCMVRVTGSDVAGNSLMHTYQWSFGTRDYCVVEGRVIDMSGAPIAGARVTVDEQSAATDQYGIYTMALAPGDYTLAISSEGHRDSWMDIVVEGDGAVASVVMEDSTILDAVTSLPGILTIVLVLASFTVVVMLMRRRSEGDPPSSP